VGGGVGWVIIEDPIQKRLDREPRENRHTPTQEKFSNSAKGIRLDITPGNLMGGGKD